MKNLIVLLLVFCSTFVIGQELEIAPIGGLPLSLKNQYRAAGTFDSTFIYTSDTITLPIFDDFSSDKFQTYDADFSGAGVTSELWYKMLDVNSTPIPPDQKYSSQVTYKYTYVSDAGTTSQDPLPSVNLQRGNLASYPVSYVPQVAYPSYFVYDTITAIGQADSSPDTILISNPDILQDSARIFFTTLNSPNKIWLDSEARRNFTLAKDPWSIGVATFDGVDSKGFPYDIDSDVSGVADHLTSKPIDMSGFNGADSVYFSFVFQRQGFGDEPEQSDSLVLEFYAHDLLQWNQVWSTTGGPVGDFEVGHILIDNPDYFKKGFQFRFKNHGHLAGMLDQFHLDYVNLRSLSGYQDTLFKDFAMVYPVNSLIKDYTSVPWDHWKNNFSGKMSDDVSVVVRNNSDISENNQNGSIQVRYAGSNESSFTLIGQSLSGGDINYSPRTTYTSYHDLSGGYHFDETKTGERQSFDILASASAQFPNFAPNDTAYSQQIFSNYYAYDDGSAEVALKLESAQSRLAMKFEPYEADSLIGVEICFVPTVNDASNLLFLLTVWDDNNGVPGNVIYEDALFAPRSPQYHVGFDVFTTYFLKDTMKLPINGTFYVGWRQLDGQSLNVGFDRNIDNSSKTYYSVDGGFAWPQSNIPGTAMIRPVFSTALDYQLGVKDIEKEDQVRLYPNPTNDILNIEISKGNVEKVEVYDIFGALQLRSDYPRISLEELPKGIYFVRVNDLPNLFKVIKY